VPRSDDIHVVARPEGTDKNMRWIASPPAIRSSPEIWQVELSIPTDVALPLQFVALIYPDPGEPFTEDVGCPRIACTPRPSAEEVLRNQGPDDFVNSGGVAGP
jgi:hypothetical protein